MTYVKKYWYIFIIAAISSALYSAVDAGMIKLLEPLVDEGFVHRDPQFIALIPIVLPLVFLARGMMSFASDYSLSWLSRKIVMTVRQELFDHYLCLPASFFDHHSSGELLSKLTFNVEQIAKAVTDAILDSIRNSFLAIFLVGVMISINWRLTAWFFIAAPFIYILFMAASYRFRKYSHQIQHSMAHMTHVAEENISGYREVKIFGGQAYERRQFADALEKNRRLEMRLELTKSISVPLIQTVGGCGLAFTLFMATKTEGVIALSAGGFASFVTAMLGLLKPIKELTNVNNKIQRGIAGAQSIFKALDVPSEQDTGLEVIERAKGGIVISDVSFRYNPEHKEALSNISLTVKPNMRVAIVGKSGSGKSTLVNLLPRLYDNYTGAITIDGIDTRCFEMGALRKQFAIVSQNVTLFNDTIARNIAYGEFEIDEKRVQEAADAAHVTEFSDLFPEKLNTLIGDDGVLLSGGQRQRLAIARAIYKNAPILILDEATSALDSVSERRIQEALDTLMQNRTSIIIAHRLSTIENADKIVVMDNGQIIEEGTHQELIGNDKLYSQLYKMQFEYGR
jgi:subfamily B ATP-binding cassette protein MsbA